MADPSIAELRQAEKEAASHWEFVRNIQSGFGKEAAETARVAHQIALLNLNKALKEENS